MAKKKDDKPYMPFYIGDWFKAPEIRALPHAERMVWFEILCLMWQGEEKGVLSIKGKPFVITDDITGVITKGEQVLAQMLGTNVDFLQETFKKLKEFEVYKVREDGAVYSGFMVKLINNKRVKSTAGKKGMAIRYSNSVITDDITNRESENENILRIIDQLESSIKVSIDESQKKYFMHLVVEMSKVFTDINPEYPFDKTADYSACLCIAYMIAEQKKWTKTEILNGRMSECLDSWRKIVEFIKQDDWLNTRALSDIATVKEWQRLTQKMNAKKGNTGKKMVL